MSKSKSSRTGLSSETVVVGRADVTSGCEACGFGDTKERFSMEPCKSPGEVGRDQEIKGSRGGNFDDFSCGIATA